MDKRTEQAAVLADAARRAVENARMGIDLTRDDPTVTPDWNYRLPDEYQERRPDPWLV